MFGSIPHNLDGSRQWVLREDAVNGSHWDVYGYDEVSGRLVEVQDELTGEEHRFAWNPEGTLARWEEAGSYARVFGYDEEGRLVKIEQDYGSGGVQVAYEYEYNSDGVRVWKRDYLAGQEYRYVCRIGCGGIPMRVYNRMMNGGSWNPLEEYVETPTVRWYGTGAESFSDFVLLAGHWLSRLTPPPSGTMLYQDWFGVRVGRMPTVPQPEYLWENEDLPSHFIEHEAGGGIAIPLGGPGILIGCAVACIAAGVYIGIALSECMKNPPPSGCQGIPEPAYYFCLLDCAITNGCDGKVSSFTCAVCGICVICRIPAAKPICRKLVEEFRKKWIKPKQPKPSPHALEVVVT